MSLFDGETTEQSAPAEEQTTAQSTSNEENDSAQETTTEVKQLTLDILPEEFRNDPALKNFSGKSDKDLLEALAKSYLGAQRLVGKGIRIPGEHSTDEERAEFFDKLQNVDGVVKLPTNDKEKEVFARKLGVPEKPEDYPVLEDVPSDLAASARAFAHSIGLTASQYKELVTMNVEQAKQQEEQLAAHEKELREKRDELLSQEWVDIPERLKGAELAAKNLAVKFGEEYIEELKTSGAVNNPIVVAALAQLGEGLQETNSLMDHKVDYGKTRAEIEDEIAQIRNNPAYFKQGVESKKLRARMIDLQKSLAG